MSITSNTPETVTLVKEDTANKNTFRVTLNLDNPTITTTNNGTVQLTSDNYINNITLTTNVVPSSQTKTVTITENGTTTITPDNNIPYLDSVVVNTNVQPKLQTISRTYTSNMTQIIAPGTGYDGYAELTISVQVYLIDQGRIGFNSSPGQDMSIANANIRDTSGASVYIQFDSETFSSAGMLIIRGNQTPFSITPTIISNTDYTVMYINGDYLYVSEYTSSNTRMMTSSENSIWVFKGTNLIGFVDKDLNTTITLNVRAADNWADENRIALSTVSPNFKSLFSN